MMATNREKHICDFWSHFETAKDRIAHLTTADHPDYDALLAKLQSVDDGLYIEFSSTDAVDCELVITTDGDPNLFPLVDAIVSAAPTIEGWAILALKPKLGFPTSTSWEEYTVRIADLVFDPLLRAGSDELGICIFVPNLAEAETQTAHNAILRAIDHGLGERCFAEEVKHTEVRPLADDQDASIYIALDQLGEYIEWRKRGR